MVQSRSKIVRGLMAAQQNQVPVTIRRKHLDVDETSGFVVAVLDDWVVAQDLSDAVHLDATVLLRLDSVTKVEPHQDQAYVSRAVAGLGEPITEFQCSPDATTGDLLRVIAESTELVGAHLESPDGDWINFGKIHRIGNKRLDLQFIGRDGVWVDFVEAWKLKNITRIEFGGRYIRALEQFGDPMPSVVRRQKR